jgi:hypothetical protein
MPVNYFLIYVSDMHTSNVSYIGISSSTAMSLHKIKSYLKASIYSIEGEMDAAFDFTFLHTFLGGFHHIYTNIFELKIFIYYYSPASRQSLLSLL